jgi:hypothetical protein
MGQFKPMVKMMTTEPTVELKLAKGGHVNMKKGGKAESGHKKMADGGGAMGALAGTPALLGRPAVNAPVRAPGKPSMAARRKAMMAKPAVTPSGPPMAPPPMKKGGKAEGSESKKTHMAEMKEMKGLEKELKSHENKPASKGHKGLKTGGVALGNGGGYKKGGKIAKFAKGGVAGDGIIPVSASSRGAEKFKNTMMHTAEYTGKSSGKTGDVKLGNGGGYKKGGKIKKYATGGVIPSESTSGSYATTEMHTARPDSAGGGTGGVRLGNAGGFKKGGSAKKAYAAGGTVNSGRPVAMPQGRKPTPAPVAISRLAGTYKNGGRATPAEAVLLKNNRAENATAMREAKTDSNLKYGSPKRMNEGGGTTDMSKGAYDAHYAREKAENEADRKMMTDALMYLPRQAKKAFNSLTGQGAVTTTEREISKTVSPPPAKKRSGGRAC